MNLAALEFSNSQGSDLEASGAPFAKRQTSWPTVPASRRLDIFLAFAALVFFAPLMILVALVVFAQDGGPILFRHTRIGLNGKSFRVLKFRSMAVDSDVLLAQHLRNNGAAAAEWARDHKLRNDPRISAIGSLLRKSSIDELPQIFNVLRGEMSIVGPRPIVQAEVKRYGRAFASYCAVRPGITGLWQVSGRNNVSYRRRVAMDTLYVRRKCFAFDARIILATVPAVLTRRGSC